MGWLTRLGAISQVALVAAAASSHIVTDPYVATLWNACPAACDSANPDDWSFYSDLSILKSCDKPMLLNFAVHNPRIDFSTHPPLYACTASKETSFGNSKVQASSVSSSARYSIKSVKMETAWRGDDASQYSSHVKAAAQILQDQLDLPASQNITIALAYSNGVALGAFFGSMMDKNNDKTLLHLFLEKLHQGELNKSGSMMQVCNSDRSAAYDLGIVSEAGQDPVEALGAVQDALATWTKGKCVQGYSRSSISQISVGEAPEQFSPSNPNSSHAGHGRFHGKRAFSGIHRRDTCRDIEVQAGNICPTLATRCGITPAEFTKFNPDKQLCGSLKAGQHVCCSAGTLTDYSPKPNADGSCHTYKIQAQDTCQGLAAANSISEDDIYDWNKKTWGWTGCGMLMTGATICLSKGDPPMPSVLKNAVCGPQMPGTKRPDNWDDISSQNPCPLNACCNIWGQCGTTDAFCTKTNSTTGAPGTAKAKTNGCISNCGTDIVHNDHGFPANFDDEPVMVGYYEAFQNTRPCLNLDVAGIENEIKIGKSFALTWDHIHFAFANVTEDFDVDISTVKKEFDQFRGYSSPGKKPKVLSFGGWSFSTDLDSYAIFRKGVTDEQRSLFATNVVKFADDNDLDGLDFDWEYPGAPDIPGIPKGDVDDGDRYLQFLKEVREKLPSEKTLSIAAPSSYWYLKGFPIKKISDVVDYIVYMTYDLHGQWDYNSTDSLDGCNGSNCLRSHVNWTETTNSLSMITKAGVPNSKIVAGLASYGRSFGMKDPSCHGPECKFTGPESGAIAGRCTKTPGYIANAEIQEWLDENDDITTYFDEPSRSTISYSSNGTWVAYNTEDERNDRITTWHDDKTVLGTSLWAIDLTEFVTELPNGQRLPSDYEQIDCTRSFDSLDDLEVATGIDDYCMNIYLIQAIQGNLTASLDKYQEIMDDGYDDDFGWYKKAIQESAPESLKKFLKAHVDEYFACTCVPMDITTRAPMKGAKSKTCDCPYAPKEGAYYKYEWEAKDKDKFETDLMKSVGIAPDWLMYGYDGSHCTHDPMTGLNQCSGSVNDGIPTLEGGFTISNPKDIISGQLPKLKNFHNQLGVISTLSTNDAYDGDTSDVVDGASTLALMVSQSVTSMKQVAKIGEDYKDDWIKIIVITFVSAVLMIIPAVGEAAEAADMAVLANTLRVIGEAGDVGMAAYDIVSSKDGGPTAIFLALLGGIGALDMIKAPSYFSKAATARKGMTAENFATLGPEIKGGMAQVDKLKATCF
ncbi:class V chitinase [Penicillium cf. griseofulvum]|uniref:chitinase n=1 Tax=Penicillium cf. griseofulvum TaxID=2972120 RepID=A0A9W9IY90_9EURO|nr:class V chitinase [Penicillium cf. griseofulvum]